MWKRAIPLTLIATLAPAAAHGTGQPIATTMEIKGDSLAGMVASIYASRDLVGIVTHGGTRTHSHWISPDGKSTAHLDSWGLKAGAELSLPKP